MTNLVDFAEAKKHIGPRGPDCYTLSPERCALLQAFWHWHGCAECDEVPAVSELMDAVLLSTNPSEPFLAAEQKALIAATVVWYWEAPGSEIDDVEAHLRYLDALPDAKMRELAAKLDEFVPSWAAD
jgi:hypothetical protein